MKTLLLLRHAKSDYPPGVADHDRPLKPRGRRAAAEVGRFLAAAPPDRILASTAVRAATTARLAAEAGDWPAEVETAAALYDAAADDLLAVVHRQDAGASTLLLVGHEPTLSEAVSRLIGGGRIRMRTTSLAQLTFDVASWAEVHFGRGVLEGLWTPPRDPAP